MDSKPNQGRVLAGVRGMVSHLDRAEPRWEAEKPALAGLVRSVLDVGEPTSGAHALVHGDFFSTNILATPTTVCVVDWDLMSLGDPMWDLAFLLEADRGVTSKEQTAALQAYRSVRAIAPERLAWNRRCWQAFWRLRDICDNDASWSLARAPGERFARRPSR